MTQLKALIIACALLFTDSLGMLGFEEYDNSSSEYTGPAVLYLLSIAILVTHVKFLPKVFLNKHNYLCIFIEAAAALIILQFALYYIWDLIEQLVSQNVDNIITTISDHDWVQPYLCYFCCGKGSCALKLSQIALKLISIVTLVVAACVS